MRGRRLSIVGAVWLAGAGAAMAQNPVTFPAALARDPLLLWLQRETDIAPERVVAVTPQALTAVVSTLPPLAGQGPRVVLRAEALSADSYAGAGALSWHVSLTADCPGHRVRLGETTGYPERNLLGERKLLRAADADWRTPEPESALDAAWRAACQRDFKGPFQAVGVKVARPEDAPPAAPAPVAARPAAPPAAPRKVASAAPRAGGVVVQVGASTSEAEAKALLAALAPRLGGRESWVETAEVGGKVWRRAVVGGFADGSDAARFCAGLKAAGRGCFVRPGRPA